MKTYSTAEICKKFGISRQRLAQLRSGYTSTSKKKKIYTYQWKAVLIEGMDWEWERGVIIYFESAIKKFDAR